MTEISPEVSAQLERVVDGLVAQTGGAIHRHDLRAVVLDCYDQLAAHATITTFLPILTERFALVQLRAKGILSGDISKNVPEVLVLDEHNAARSQTAAALIRFYAPGRFHVTSAGVTPQGPISPVVTELLGEVGLGLTDFPKPATDELMVAADVVIAIGDVPLDLDSIPGQLVHWDVPAADVDDRQSQRANLEKTDASVRGFLRTVDPDHELHEPVLTSGQ
ncbi:MAG: low molecular weight phosphatase family protein [Candidatus Nanopelagicales bacterium]